MKDIDFLPARYSEQHALRRANLWHLALFGVLTLVVGISAASQFATRRSLQQELAAAASARAESEAKYAQIAQIRSDLAAACDEARLYNYLRSPWPRTQLLSETVRILPESLSLTEVAIAQENTGPTSAGWEAKTTGQQFTGPRQDFERLRSQNDRRRTVITLSGLTQDSRALHAYVTQLGLCPLFAGAELESLESLSEEEFQSSTASFLVRIVVIPGYCRPGGPNLSTKTIVADRRPTDVHLPRQTERIEQTTMFVCEEASR